MCFEPDGNLRVKNQKKLDLCCFNHCNSVDFLGQGEDGVPV